MAKEPLPSNGDQYTGDFINGSFNGKGTFNLKKAGSYEGDFVNGQAEGKGKLTTEQEVVLWRDLQTRYLSTKIRPPDMEVFLQ